MSYVLHGRIKSLPGRGRELADIVCEQGEAELMPGCRLYLVSVDPGDPDAVWVTEVWDRKEDHEASLQLSHVRDSIARALPIIDREGMTSQELEAIAGIPG